MQFSPIMDDSTTVPMINALQELTEEEISQLAIKLGAQPNLLEEVTEPYVRLLHIFKELTILVCLDNDPDLSQEKILNSLEEMGMKTKAESITAKLKQQVPASETYTHLSELSTDPGQPSLRGVIEVQATITKLKEKYSLAIESTQSDLYAKEEQDSTFFEKFQDYLLCLPMNVRMLHTPFLQNNEDEIIDAVDNKGIVSILGKYCNYTNYDLLLCLANKFCNESTRKRMQNYHVSFEEFEKTTAVDVYLDAIGANENLEMALTYMALNLKKRPSKCTMYELRVQKREFHRAKYYSPYLHHQSNWIQDKKRNFVESVEMGTCPEVESYIVPELVEAVPREAAPREAACIARARTTYLHKYTGKDTNLIIEDYGIELHVPPAPQGTDVNIELSVTTFPFNEDQFILPENVSLVSAIYKVTTTETLPVPVTMRIQHCVPYEDHDEPYLPGLAFITASDNGPPYKFKPVSDGKFPRESSYGQIDVTNFSFWGTIRWWCGWPMSFFIGIFYRNTTARFVVTQNLKTLISDVRDQCNKAKLKLEFERSTMCDIHTKKITLNVPEVHDGWRIKPTSMPTGFDMENILQYEPGQVCPNVEFQMVWNGRGPPRESNVNVKIEGGSVESVVLCCKPRESQEPTDPPQMPILEHMITSEDFAVFPKPKLVDLMNIVGCFVLVNWREIGLGLGLRQSDLDVIASDSSLRVRIYAVFTRWHDGGTSEYSWKKLTEVLCSPLVDKQGLLADIYAKLSVSK